MGINIIAVKNRINKLIKSYGLDFKLKHYVYVEDSNLGGVVISSEFESIQRGIYSFKGSKAFIVKDVYVERGDENVLIVVDVECGEGDKVIMNDKTYTITKCNDNLGIYTYIVLKEDGR